MLCELKCASGFKLLFLAGTSKVPVQHLVKDCMKAWTGCPATLQANRKYDAGRGLGVVCTVRRDQIDFNVCAIALRIIQILHVHDHKYTLVLLAGIDSQKCADSFHLRVQLR